MKKFKKIYVEITNVCNLCCSFCHQTTRAKKYMDPVLFEKVLEETKPFTDYLYLHVMGEPLLHADLGLFLDLCEKFHLNVNLTTNGTLIGRLGQELIKKKALRQINFSLHSLDGNVGMDQEKYLTSLYQFTKSCKEENRIYCSYRLWNYRQGEENEKNDQILQKLAEEYGFKMPIVKNINTNSLKLDEKVFLQQSYSFDWPDLKEEERFLEGGCYGLRDHIGILADGSVIPCCLDSEGALTLGNIVNEPLAKILENPKAEAMRIGFKQKKRSEKLCRTCGFTLHSQGNPLK